MSIVRTCGVVAALVAAVCLAQAYPTLTGPTGLAVLPTAMTASSVTLAADWQELDDDSGIPIRLVIPLGGNAEIGAMYTPFDSDIFPELDRMMGANAKFGIGRFLGGEGALGAQFVRLEFEDDFEIDYPQAYFAWTTHLGGTTLENVGLTWGVNWTRSDPDIGDEEDAFRLFAGASLGLSRSIAILGEIQSADSDLGDASPISSVAARFGLGRTASAQVGFTNAFGVLGREDHDLFAGLNFQFGD